MVNLKYRLVSLAVSFALSACATTKVTTQAKLAARNREMNTAQKVAVRPAGGAHGSELTSKLRSAISAGGLHTLLVDGASGASVVIGAETGNDEYSNQLKNEVEKKCVSSDKKGRCTKYVDITVYERDEYCASTVLLKATSVADGRVIFERSIREAAAANNSKENELPPEEGRALCRQAFDKAATAAARYITPYHAQVELEFHNVEGDQGRTEQAVALAKVSNFNEAHKVLGAVANDSALPKDGQAWANYNLAVVLWALADFPECVRQLDAVQGVIGTTSEFTALYRNCKEYQQ